MTDPKWLEEDKSDFYTLQNDKAWLNDAGANEAELLVENLERAYAEIDRLTGRIKELEVDPQRYSANYTEAELKLLQQIDPEFTDQVTEADGDL